MFARRSNETDFAVQRLVGSAAGPNLVGRDLGQRHLDRNDRLRTSAPTKSGRFDLVVNI
jgi:hypothetical protein